MNLREADKDGGWKGADGCGRVGEARVESRGGWGVPWKEKNPTRGTLVCEETLVAESPGGYHPLGA